MKKKKTATKKPRWNESTMIRIRWKARRYVEHVRKQMQKQHPTIRQACVDAIDYIISRLPEEDKAIYEKMKE